MNPEILDVHDQEQEQQGTEQSHGPAVPLTPFVGKIDLITFTSSRNVFCFQNISLDNVQDKAYKETCFQDPHHNCVSHKMGSLIEHFAFVICPNAGIQSNMHH